jgi:parallel beta-helix repeat protein
MNWIAIVLLSFGVTWGKTLVVGATGVPCPNAGYTTIGAAVTAAASGDVIEICPALYPEQLLITKPLTLVGIGQMGVGRVLIQPATFGMPGGFGFEAVIVVTGTSNVTISNLAIDASINKVSGCTVGLSGIHFYNASGVVDGVAISGAQLSDPLSCTTLFPGNGAGVQVDGNTGSTSDSVTVRNSSIHDFGRNGILVIGPGEWADVNGNSIQGAGPSSGVFQFGVFLANGATGQVIGNNITEGNCGSLDISSCINVRSEGVVLRSSGNGVVISNNVISNVQAGVFVNVATNPLVTGNTISNVDALSAIHLQGSVSGLITANRIFHVGPLTVDTSEDEEGCGINDVSGTSSATNAILGNWVNDSYCGVGYVSTDVVGESLSERPLQHLEQRQLSEHVPSAGGTGADPSSDADVAPGASQAGSMKPPGGAGSDRISVS